MEAVAQTPGEATESFLRAGSEIAHRIRHAKGVHPEVVTASCSDGHLRERAAAFPGGLYATASMASACTSRRCSVSAASASLRALLLR